MPRCRDCQAEITFGPHPQKPSSQAPLDRDGELHFVRCPARKKPTHTYRDRDEILCKKCEQINAFVFIKETGGGPRYVAMCQLGHQEQIAKISEHRDLINATEDEADLFKKIHHLRFQVNPYWQTRDAIAHIRNQAHSMIDSYIYQFGEPSVVVAESFEYWS